MDGGGGLLQQRVKGGLVNLEGALEMEKASFSNHPRRQWQPTPVLLPGKSHGWRSLVIYSPWGCKESDMTE